MKINIEVKDVREAKDLLSALGENEINLRIGKTTATPTLTQTPTATKPVIENRKPLTSGLGKKKPLGITKKKGYTGNVWTKQDEQDLKDWYFNPHNHYANGRMIAEKVMEFAKAHNRTVAAVQVRVIILKLNKKLVRGFMAAGKVVLKSAFPTFKSVVVPDGVLIGIFKQLTSKEGNTFKFGKDLVQSVGITTTENWHEFVYESLTMSADICKSLGVKPLLHLGREGSDLWIEYSVKQ